MPFGSFSDEQKAEILNGLDESVKMWPTVMIIDYMGRMSLIIKEAERLHLTDFEPEKKALEIFRAEMVRRAAMERN